LPPRQVTRTVLDTHFSSGDALLDTAVAWLEAPYVSGVLHYVALCEVDDLVRWRKASAPTPLPHKPALREALRAELYGACASALPGIQRLLLAQGRISLTLCAGALQTMLSEQSFHADEIRIHLTENGATAVARWDKWAVQLLARRCRRGTVVAFQVDAVKPDLCQLKAQFVTQGFAWRSEVAASSLPPVLQAVYAPRWELRTSRTPHAPPPTPPQRCAVVGAGLAGASVAQALALRGWHVTVLDAHDLPAQGASGLPVGLLVPHVSADDSPRSRMSRVGTRLTLQHAQHRLHQGSDWSLTGVLQLNADADRCLAASASLVEAGWLAPGHTANDSLWHSYAGWIKPSCLVAAWLTQPGIQVRCNTQVQRLQRVGNTWRLQNALGETVAEAELVVVANAMGALPLLENLDAAWALAPEVLDTLQRLQALHGTVSQGPMPTTDTTDTTAFPAFAVNGSGSLVAHVPTAVGPQWVAGATYETNPAQLQDTRQQQAANWERLNALWPPSAAALAAQFNGDLPQRWTGTRCVSHDRLPLVGPAHADAASGLWLSVAMGSRGLSFAALCAELLAARLGSEPLPLEARLAKSLDLHRPRRLRAKRQGLG
jgi:tRNA 5-methylaminomethyl-2-thiouridine biosynthesis bifunctional protein